MTSINWWTFSWVSKWKWSQGQFLMNKLHIPRVRLTVIFWHINSFIIKGSAKFRNKAECLLVLSKRFFPFKSIMNVKGAADHRIQHTQQVSPCFTGLLQVDQIENFQGWESNHLRRGGGRVISVTFLLCVNWFGSFTSGTTKLHQLL